MAQNGSAARRNHEKMTEAKEVYLLMKEEYRISRNTRAAWFFNHLNKPVMCKKNQEVLHSDEELEVLSVIPSGEETSESSTYEANPFCELVGSTHISFLARRYRMVFIFDFSPSMASVDIQLGQVNIMNSFNCLSNCLRGLIKPFHVPGSSLILSPKIYITVIAYTPVSALTTQQVLVQGRLVTADVVEDVLQSLQLQIEDFENKLFSCVSKEDPDSNGYFLSPHVSGTSHPPPEMAFPESCFMNMLWCGYLALQLLPANTSAGIVMISDGVIGVREDPILNNALTQLRDSTISCSFIQVGHGFLPHSGFGYIPHTEIMQFIATATMGSFLDQCPLVPEDASGEMNIYHTALLLWSFQKDLDPVKGYHQSLVTAPSLSEPISSLKSIGLRKPRFPNLPLQRVKHREDTLQTDLFNVMSVRLREGYTIKQVSVQKSKGLIEVRLALPCTHSGQIEYVAKGPWPPISNRKVTYIEVVMEGTYDFVHDINCPLKKTETRSTLKKRVIKNFWQMIRSLRDTDKLLVHMQSFAVNPAYYVVPEGTSKGMPLFYMPPNSDNPVLSLQHAKKDDSLSQFAQFWKRIALMEPKQWQRWLHTHHIAMLLMPDQPLPKHLHHPNTSGRFGNVQCKLAQNELNALLTDWATFILLENHSYINITYEDKNSPPTSFFIIRVICKGLTVVLRLAFLGGTPAYVRNKIVNELKEKLARLCMSQKHIRSKDSTRIAKGRKISIKGNDPKPTLKKPCVLLLQRPVEVILVKYEKMPTDFTDLKLSSEVTAPSVPVYMNRGPDKKLNRLACYLHHRRWIWDAQGDQAIQIASQNVLSVLTRFKLQQDFRIAYSQGGIISFIAELNLKSVQKAPSQGDTVVEESLVESERNENSLSTDKENLLPEAEGSQAGSDLGEGACEGEVFKCLVQFVIFPPHVETLTKVQDPGDDEDMDMSEADGKLQLITECWVEPQCGTIIDSPAGREFFNGQQYMNVPDLLFPADDEIVRTLLLYEHLKSMCKESNETPITPQLSSTPCVSITESILHMPFSLDILQLIPKCRELEMVCSTFLEALISIPMEGLQYPQPNETLFSLLLSSLAEDGTTNLELKLTKEQSLKFCDMILRKDYSERSPPFKITREEVSAIINDVEKLNSQQKTRTRSGSDLGESRGNWRRPRADTIDEADVLPKIPHWACFIRYFNSDSLLLVILPASYKDLLKLQGKAHAPVDPESDSSSLSGTGGEKNITKETSIAEGLEEKTKAQPSRSSTTLKTGKADSASRGKRKKVKKLRHQSEEEPKISYNLPIFVYDCTLSSLANRLLEKDSNKVRKDVLKDITFASMEKVNVPGTPRSTRRLGRIPSDSDELSEASKKASFSSDCEKPHMSRELEWFFCLLSNKVHKAFVVAVFKSLQHGQVIDRKDVLAAIDNICVESLCEIDITSYVQAVCGHIRETSDTFCEESDTKESFRKQLKFVENVNTKEENEGEDAADCQTDEGLKKEESLSNPIIKKEVIRRIPLSAFLARQTCEVQTGLHNLIKTKFTQIMGSYFKQIPSNENLWFYCLHDIDDLAQYSSQSQNYSQDEVDTSGTEFVAEKDLLQAEGKTQLTDTPQSENTSESNNSSKEEDRKINSIVDNYLILKPPEELSDRMSDDGRTSIMSQCGSMEEEISPLFVTLVCTIKHKSNVGNMPVQTIPACLGVLLDCLESPEEEIIIDDLRLTLDLICLTLPPDFDACTPYDEEGSEYSDRRRGTSFSEPSPPDSPPAEIIRQNPRSGFKLSVSEFDEFTSDFVDDTLESLPEYQKNSIQATQEEIKWLLKDEIASARRHIFPVTVTTLDMVADHVCNSLGKDTCLHQQVDLKFVFGPEQSLSEFVKEFEEIKVAGYQLNKIHDSYYLSLDQMASDKDLDGSWPSNQLETHLQQASKSDISVNVSESTSDVATRITFTPPSPQKTLDPPKAKKEQEEQGSENVLSQVEVFEKVAEKLSGTGDTTLEECREEPQKAEAVAKDKEKDGFESDGKCEKKEVDNPEKDARDDGEEGDEGGENDIWSGARKIQGNARKMDEMQESSKSSLVSSEWQSASESLPNQTESDSDSDIQVLTDEDVREAEYSMKLQTGGLVVGSLEEDEDSQRTLTRTSGILVLKKGETGSNQRGEERHDDSEDGISPAKWSNSESGMLGSESSVSSQQRSDSSLGLAADGLSQFLEGVRSESRGRGASYPPKVKRVVQPNGKQFEEKSDLGKVQGADEMRTSEDGAKNPYEMRTSDDGAKNPKSKNNSKLTMSETEGEKNQPVAMPQKQRNSSGDSSKTFSPRDQEFPTRDDSPQGVVRKDNSSTAHRVGRSRDTPGSRHTSSTGGTTISGPLSAQVSCNSLSGSLTECDEEGYEAGSSEDEFGDSHVFSEDDFSAKQKMPDFWLILKIQEDKEELENKKYKMNMYFHTRYRGDGVRLQAQRAVFDQVADAIQKTCRLVSQRLLLIDLFDSKVCNPLLLADDESWNKESDYGLPIRGRSSSDSGPELNVMVEGDYLAARMNFDPGHFACIEQFTAHLEVHSRLPSTRKGTGKMSGGMHAVKTALEAFAISNRPDLYVVKDDSGEVFYIRLSEVASTNVYPTSSRVSIASDSLQGTEPGSLQVSRASSVQNLATDDEPPSPSVTDLPRDPIPESSKAPTSHSRTISVSIYGLKKPGPEIHRDLISLLQKRLDQVTLDVIKDMLDKNAMSRLTVADVQFIQPPGKAPTKTVQFTVPIGWNPYVFAIGFYLQQNLLEFLFVPKYVDSRPMYHFQDYTLKDKSLEKPLSLEKNTFLYNRPHRAGGTGIGCIIVSVVDGKGNPVNLQTCPRPSPDGYQEILTAGNLHHDNGDESSKFISPVDFVQLTTTKEYQPSRIGAKGPGPAFLFQFNIWERGNIDVAHLITKLQLAVHHALCDVIMEYRILTAPLASLPTEVLSMLKGNSNMAPLSPTGALRAELFQKLGPTSNPVIPQTVPVKKRSFSVGETDMRSLWKNFHLKTSESSSLTSYSPITPPDMPRSAEPSQHPATHPVKILKRSTGSTPRSPSISSADSGSKSSKRQLVFDKKEVEPSSDHSPLPSHPTTPTKAPSAEPSPRKGSKEEPAWQTREQERRQNEELNKHLREAEDGLTGRLHWIYTDFAKQWLDFEKESGVCSVHKMTEKLQSRFSVDLVLLALVTKLPQVCADTTFKLFQKTKEGYTLYQPSGPKKNRFSSPQGQHRNIPRPGTQESFVLIGRNIHQWRYSLDYRLTEEDLKAPDLINPQSRKSFQQFDPCDLRSSSSSELSKLTSVKGNTQSLHLVPRQRLLILYVKDKELTLYTYNWSAELVHSFEAFFHRLIMWHNSRSHLVDCLVMQKMGLYHHKNFGDTGQEDNPFCKYMSEIDSLVKQLLPPTQSTSSHGPSTSLPRPQRKRHPILPPFDETMAVGKIPRPLHMSHFNAWTDPVLRHGAQLQEICNQTRRDSDIQMKLQGLYTVWQQKKKAYQPISPLQFDTLETLKQQSRLLTHCATPILFSPQWRKHALQDHHDSEPVGQSPGSPVREETWHVSLRLSFLQQYIQYLTMNRFHVIETTPDSPRRSFSLTTRLSRESGRKLPEGHGRRVKTTTVKYMQITVLGGIILAELSFEHVFFCVRLYAFESSRLPRELNINSRLGMLFTDECDSFKDLIHLHSFSYDFHLRTVQEYLSSPEVGFKVQYHVTSFLSDFIKFFNPIPRFCKSVIHSETQGFLSHNTPAPDLYNYLTKHKLSEFFILHMARPDANEEQGQESALVSFNRGQFTEYLGRRNYYPDEISVSFIISWDQKEYESSTRPGTPIPGYICEAAALSNQSESEKNKNLMRLKYYLIVNSMKQLYPERGRGLTMGKGAMVGAEVDLLTLERNPRYTFAMNDMERKRVLVKELVSQAASSCRRDMLWDKLLKYETESVVPSKKSKKKDTNEGMVELAISYAEFKVLLESVEKVSLTKTDDRLVALLDNSRPWYENLLQSLRVRFNVMARYFKSEDGMIHQLALLNQTYKSMMVLLTVDFQASAVELDAVYKAQQDWNAASQESQNQEDLCCQKHVEMVINAICFHLWTSIL